MKTLADKVSTSDIQFYNDYGYVVLKPNFSSQLITRVHDDVSRLLLEKRGLQRFQYRETESILHQKSSAVKELISSDFLFELSGRLVGDDVDVRFCFTLTKTLEYGEPVDWHQDWGLDEDKGHPRITCWVAITDSDVGNGCIHLFPGSHKKDLLPHEVSETHPPDKGIKVLKSENSIPIEMEAGQILVLHPQVIHGSGKNISGKERVAILVSYQVPKRTNNEFWAKAGLKFIRHGKKIWEPLELNEYEV